MNTLYLLPIWPDQGWYSVTDYFAIYQKYGTQEDFRTLVQEAHNHKMRVLLDFAGTIGVPPNATILQQHPDWLILNEDNSAYYSWTGLLGIDTNRPDVQEYFVQVAKYYVETFNIDGYRCDSAGASPYEMFEKIRAAIQAVKPDAVLIAEGEQPIYQETTFDATYDFRFLTFASSLANSTSANNTASWLNGEIDAYPPGALRLRFLEDHDLNYTTASQYGPAGYQAFGALLFTIDGIPMIYNGQEVGNLNPQSGPWRLMDWNANPQAAQFKSLYTNLIHIRLRYPALQQGATVPVNSTDGRVAAYARVLTGADPVLVVINFSNSQVNTTLGVSLQALGLRATPLLVNALDNEEYPAIDARSFNLSLEPYQEYVFVPVENATLQSYSGRISTSEPAPNQVVPTWPIFAFMVVAALGTIAYMKRRWKKRLPTRKRK